MPVCSKYVVPSHTPSDFDYGETPILCQTSKASPLTDTVLLHACPSTDMRQSVLLSFREIGPFCPAVRFELTTYLRITFYAEAYTENNNHFHCATKATTNIHETYLLFVLWPSLNVEVNNLITWQSSSDSHTSNFNHSKDLRQKSIPAAFIYKALVK